MNDSSLPKLERRWYRFSLRTLLVLVVVLCVGFGWIGLRLRQARNDRRIVAELSEIALVEVRYEWGRVVLMKNDGPSLTDAELEHLKGLTNLQCLILNSPQVSDAGLKHLKGLKLKRLDLIYCDISDAGLEHLKELTSLQNLDLRLTRITDAGLERLNGLTELKNVDLRSTQVTDEGVNKLQQALPDCTIHH